MQAGHSGRSTSDGEYDWPQGHLDCDQHRRQLIPDTFLDAATGTATYLYGTLATRYNFPFPSSVPKSHIAHVSPCHRSTNTYCSEYGPRAHQVRSHAGHSGLTGSRLDDTLPLLHSHMLPAGLPCHAGALEQQQWALPAPDMPDQATASSPLQPHPHPPVRRPPVRSSSSFSGQVRIGSAAFVACASTCYGVPLHQNRREVCTCTPEALLSQRHCVSH